MWGGGRMRKPKFRAWSSENNRYCDFVTLDESGRWIGWIKSSGVYLTTVDIILEQYTGLKDKNGKDIYDGDIMKYNSLLRTEKYYRYVIAWNPIDMAFGCASLEQAFIDYPDIVGGAQITDSVIIGNIYDNPELLKMERKIGEKFNYGDVTLEVKENTNGKSCGDCYFLHNWCAESFDTRGKCSKRARDDKRDVYFKEIK